MSATKMEDHEHKALENRFHQQMLNIYARARDEAKYNATRFLQMVTERGGIGTAQYLLAGKVTDVSEGFTQLALRERLDLSVEALVLEDQWRSLFSDKEISNAEARLRAYKGTSQ